MIYRDKYDKNLVIRESSSILGLVNGCIFVENHANLQIHGMVIGKIIIEKGSEVFLHGMVTGTIENHGSLYIYGVLTGHVETITGAVTKIDNRARIIDSEC